MGRTLAQRHSADGIVKAGELIEIRGTSALTLHDRRVFNLLIENAGAAIGENVSHRIAIGRLRAPRHRGGERVDTSIKKLMQTLAEVKVKDSAGNAATRRMQLLSDTTTTDDEDAPNGEVVYAFTPKMRELLKSSNHWGRIKATVMFAFTSKYSLQLYELLCLRGNLRRHEEVFSFADLRELVGVPKDRLERAPDFLRRVIQPAELEINALSDFNVKIRPERDGGLVRGKLTGFRIEWQRKTHEEWMAVTSELLRPKIGRRARISGKVERIA